MSSMLSDCPSPSEVGRQVTPEDVREALALVADLRALARELAALEESLVLRPYAPASSASSITSARSGGRRSCGAPPAFK